MWAKDYFVNARGRTGDLETNVKTISGEIIIYHEGITNPDFVSDVGNGSNKENLHLTELNKYLTALESNILISLFLIDSVVSVVPITAI